MLELSLGIVILIVGLAFVCEYIDSTLGMGYGTALAPFLLIIGFKPLQVVPVILLSELISGLLAAFFHHRAGNANLRLKTTNFPTINRKPRILRYIEGFRTEAPLHLKVALFLALYSVIGTVAAVFVAVNIPKFWLKFYIGCLVFSMGVVILATLNKQYNFTWKKITILGLIASFNKGMSGGGYGPIVTGGQILSGIESRSAVGITSLAEGLTCLVGVIAYILVANRYIDWKLAPYVIAGAVLAVPFSAKSVKKIDEKRLKLAIAVLTIFLGTFTLLKTL